MVVGLSVVVLFNSFWVSVTFSEKSYFEPNALPKNITENEKKTPYMFLFLIRFFSFVVFVI